jgi:hypothetical protein
MAMVMCRKCGRMTLVPYDAKPTDVAHCTHCGSEVQKPAAKENVMPDMLFDPEQQSFAGAEGAFVPPGAAPVARASDVPEEKKPGPELPRAKVRPTEDEPWKSAPMGTQPAPTSAARGTTQGNRLTKVGRKKRNPAAELVKMIVGGIVGLAIGYGILLYGFKVDPFNMARYLPDAMVPESVKTP